MTNNMYKLSEILTLIGGGTPKTTNPSYWGGSIPWLSVVDFNNDNRYVHTTEKTITEDGVQNSSTKILPQGALILSARGTVGALAQLAKPMAFNQSCYGITAKEQTTNDFLYYLLKNVVKDLQAKGHGSVFNTITRDTFDTITVNLPPLEEQKRIAQILGSLDDKIELLQKQNKTLEDMAKAIFKSWFVDFDVVHAKQKGLPKADIMREYHLTDELYDLFPSDFENSSLGPIPLGWQVKTVQDLGEVVCGKTPSTSHKEYYGGSMPFITIPDMHNSIFANKTERYLTRQGEQTQPTKTLPPFSVCVSCIATPGLVSMTTIHSQTNQQINSVIPHNLEAKFYNYYVLRSVADQIRAQGSGGSVFVNLNKTAFSKIKVLWADQTLQKLFTKESEIYFDKILNNLKQIQTLTELRDTLLPPLISGKIRV